MGDIILIEMNVTLKFTSYNYTDFRSWKKSYIFVTDKRDLLSAD